MLPNCPLSHCTSDLLVLTENFCFVSLVHAILSSINSSFDFSLILKLNIFILPLVIIFCYLSISCDHFENKILNVFLDDLQTFVTFVSDLDTSMIFDYKGDFHVLNS